MRIKLDQPFNSIDIGCANKKKEGCLGIDIVDHGQEIVWDITHGIPLPDNSISYVYSSHCLEHLELNDVHFVMREIRRICRPGARFDLRLPHADSIEAHYAGHVSFWSKRMLEGMITSYNNLGMTYRIIRAEHIGIELQAEIEIVK